MEFQARRGSKGHGHRCFNGFVLLQEHGSKLQLAWCRSRTRHHSCAKRIPKTECEVQSVITTGCLQFSLPTPPAHLLLGGVWLNPIWKQFCCGITNFNQFSLFLCYMGVTLPTGNRATSASTQSHKTSRCEESDTQAHHCFFSVQR